MKTLRKVSTLSLALLTVFGLSQYTPVQAEGETDKEETTEKTQTEDTKAVSSTEKSDSASREETVYVISDPSGDNSNVIVSSWLKNKDKASTINDSTDLKDIQNVEGDETYKVNTDGTISWDAQGNDIYYQGITDKALPVSVKISYQLDGKDVSADEIAGKSGHVKIRFDYKNDSKEDVEVDGKTKSVTVPFAMVSGVELPSDNFTNVTAENGKVISSGKNNYVVGMAFPGLKEALNLKGKDIGDVDIPEYFEIDADAEDFKLDMTLTMASSDILADLDLDKINSDELKSDLDKLQDGADQLLDGTKDLKDGTSQLVDGTNDLADGASTLKNGTSDLVDGTKTLSDGAHKVDSGAGDLKSGADKVASGAGQVSDGASQLSDGVDSAKAGVETLSKGVGDLKSGADQLNDGAHALAGIDEKGKAALDKDGKATGAKALAAGANKLAGYIDETGNSTVDKDGNPTGGTAALKSGVQSLQSGISSAENGISKLHDAVSAASGTTKLTDEQKQDEQEKYISDLVTANQNAFAALRSQISSGIDGIADMQVQSAKQIQPLWDNGEEADENSETSCGDETIGSTPANNDNTGNITASEDNSGQQNSDLKDDPSSSELTNSKLDNSDVGTQDPSKSVVEKVSSDDTDGTEFSDSTANGSDGDSVDTEINTSDAKKAPAVLEDSLANDSDVITSGDAAEAILQGAADGTMTKEQLMNLIDQYAAQSYTAGYKKGATDQGIKDITSNVAESSKVSADQITGIINGINTLYDNMFTSTTLTDGTTADVGKLSVGAKALSEGITNADSGAKALAAGANALSNNADELAKGASGVASGVNNLAAGASDLKDGTDKLTSGVSTLKAGTSSLKSGASDLASGAGTLKSGTSDLATGADTLKNGAQDLDNGAGDLLDGALTLKDGALDLDDGAQQLLDGMQEFYDEGIEKLVNAIGDDLPDTLDNLEAVVKAGQEYTSFAGKSDSKDDTVKFIFKTNAIKNDSDN